MNKSEINWKSGEVVGWDIDCLDLSKSSDSQIDILKEDLLLVQFENSVNLGLGWFPEFNSKGQFILAVVRLENWENPVFQLKFRDVKQFVQNLNQAIAIADKLAN